MTNLRAKWFTLRSNKAVIDIQWVILSLAVSSLASFLLRIIFGRELGAEGLGIFTLAYSVYYFGMQFAAFGIGPALTRYIAQYVGDSVAIKNFVSSGMTSAIITGAFTGAILFIFAPYIAVHLFHTPELESMIQLIAFCYPFIAIQMAVSGTLNGFRQMRSYALMNIIQSVSVFVVSIMLVIYFEFKVTGSVLGFVGPTILIGVICPILIRKYVKLDHSLWNIPALRLTARFGFYVGLGNAIIYLNSQVDSILIGYYMDPTEVGLYSVAVLLSQTLILVPSAIQRVTAPTTAMLYGKNDFMGVKTLFYSTLRKSLFMCIIFAIILAVTSPYIIGIIFPGEYLASYGPLLILLVGYTANASFTAVGATLSSIGKVHIPVRIGAVCAFLNITLNFIFIPHYGIIGAAVATTLTLILNVILSILAIRNYIGGYRLGS